MITLFTMSERFVYLKYTQIFRFCCVRDTLKAKLLGLDERPKTNVGLLCENVKGLESGIEIPFINIHILSFFMII